MLQCASFGVPCALHDLLPDFLPLTKSTTSAQWQQLQVSRISSGRSMNSHFYLQ